MTNIEFDRAKKRREIIFNFINKAQAKSRTIREVIDFCSSKEVFKNSYVSEAVKQNYLVLIRKNYLKRINNNLIINIKI